MNLLKYAIINILNTGGKIHHFEVVIIFIKVIKTERRKNKICNQSKLEMKRHISLNPNKHGDIK